MVKAAYSSGWGGDSRGLFAVFGGSRRAPWIPGAVLAWPESDVSTYRCGILVCLSISVFFFFFRVLSRSGAWHRSTRARCVMTSLTALVNSNV